MNASIPLIILSHGSRHPHADREVEALANRMCSPDRPVRAAYLDFSPRTLHVAAEEVGSAVVVPLLFTSAFHVTDDVPAVVTEASRKTGTRLHLAAPLGTGEDIARLVASRIPHGAEGAVVYYVGSRRAHANETVERLADRVAELTGIPAYAHRATGKDPLPDLDRAHVVPLFVAHGLLLDKLQLPAGWTMSEPLSVALADIVAARYEEVAA
ncbi:CbiX/SirB N-terminal domain-containing protein [uncultured Corynebacterium sp.]|uniref:sirohydrochlorin chelatase n=1 Tax=uncultured Corynebacterium sp. TaxID=159447 RepID=UPI00262AC741|nr:CbiX/SirB N-terminal domain-containing protein [uncultured Corynebacterium sp.]